MALEYPAEKLTVYVYDDGGDAPGRPSIRELVERLAAEAGGLWVENLRYTARRKEKGKPHHAKAGNINALIAQDPPGEFLAIFDADMIAASDFLQCTMPLFFESNTYGELRDDRARALVQTPQFFTNVPAADFCDIQQHVWYHSLCPGLDGHGATPFCGSNAVLRKSALLALPNKGFPYGSVTEDLHTSLQLLKHGFTT